MQYDYFVYMVSTVFYAPPQKKNRGCGVERVKMKYNRKVSITSVVAYNCSLLQGETFIALTRTMEEFWSFGTDYSVGKFFFGLLAMFDWVSVFSILICDRMKYMSHLRCKVPAFAFPKNNVWTLCWCLCCCPPQILLLLSLIKWCMAWFSLSKHLKSSMCRLVSPSRLVVVATTGLAAWAHISVFGWMSIL